MLPPTVKAAVAGMPLKTAEEFEATIKKADEVYQAIKTKDSVAALAASAPKAKPTSAAQSVPKKKADLDTSADAPALDQMAHLAEQIAAFNKKYQPKKTGNSGGNSSRGTQQKRGNGRGGAGQYRPRGRGNPHPDGPPDNCYNIHCQFGRNAYYCLSPSTCPWAEYKGTPPGK